MPDARKAVVEVYRRLTGRQPSADEVELLLRLQKKQQEKFLQNPEKTRGWLNAGLYKVDPKLDAALLAANAVVANTILNSDASLTRR